MVAYADWGWVWEKAIVLEKITCKLLSRNLREALNPIGFQNQAVLDDGEDFFENNNNN